jgi:hypothetical protein
MFSLVRGSADSGITLEKDQEFDEFLEEMRSKKENEDDYIITTPKRMKPTQKMNSSKERIILTNHGPVHIKPNNDDDKPDVIIL